VTEEHAVFNNYFDREHDVLVISGDPSPLLRDLELHLLAYDIQYDPLTVQLLRDGLIAMSLYLLSKPKSGSFGWTVSLKDPRMNLFFSGSARDQTVIGRPFFEDLREEPRSLLYVQTSRPTGKAQTSCIEVEGLDIFGMIELYSRQSDQRELRFFHTDDQEAGLVQTFPGTESEWFEAQNNRDLAGLVECEGIRRLLRHSIRFYCGCDSGRILRLLVHSYGEKADELFLGDPSVEAECPRCGAQHVISREHYAAALIHDGDPTEGREGPADA
jgi:molecular chaperone Hsp33